MSWRSVERIWCLLRGHDLYLYETDLHGIVWTCRRCGEMYEYDEVTA